MEYVWRQSLPYPVTRASLPSQAQNGCHISILSYHLLLHLMAMVKSTMTFSMPRPCLPTPTLHSSKVISPIKLLTVTIQSFVLIYTSLHSLQPKTYQRPKWSISNGRASSFKVKALPDLTLMAVMVEHAFLQRDFYVHKTVWHLSDEAIKNIC